MAAVVCGFAALLPDADHPRSWAGRRLPGVSWAAGAVFGHRGALHSLAGAAAVSWVVVWAAKLLGLAISWKFVFLGYIVHLLLDMLTPAGVAWLWPLPQRISLPLATTGGGLERIVITPALFLFVVWNLAKIVL